MKIFFTPNNHQRTFLTFALSFCHTKEKGKDIFSYLKGKKSFTGNFFFLLSVCLLREKEHTHLFFLPSCECFLCSLSDKISSLSLVAE
jgi:hypothetical protein